MVESTKICWIVVSGVSAFGHRVEHCMKDLHTFSIVCGSRQNSQSQKLKPITHNKLRVLAGTHFF